MQKMDGKPVTVYMTNRQIEAIEKIAKRHEMRKSDVTRILLDIGIDTYEAYARIGVPQLAQIIKKAKRVISDAALSEKQPKLF